MLRPTLDQSSMDALPDRTNGQGLFDIQQIRVAKLHIPRAQVMNRAPLAVIGGGALVSVMIWVLWFSGRYCRPLLPLRMILGLSWLALLVVLAGYLLAPHSGAETQDLRLVLVAIFHRFFFWMGTGDWLRLVVVLTMSMAAAIVTWRIGYPNSEPRQRGLHQDSLRANA